MNQDLASKRAVIYYRVSTSEQAERGFSLDNQKQACIKYADNNNYQRAKFFSDEGKSAKTANRPGLQSMLKFCSDKKNQIEAIIVYKVDRLTRNVEDYSSIGTCIKKQGIKLISTTEAI